MAPPMQQVCSTVAFGIFLCGPGNRFPHQTVVSRLMWSGRGPGEVRAKQPWALYRDTHLHSVHSWCQPFAPGLEKGPLWLPEAPAMQCVCTGSVAAVQHTAFVCDCMGVTLEGGCRDSYHVLACV